MSDLIYPTLDLFIYALKTSLNSTDAETQKNKENFSAQLPTNTQFYDPDIESEYLELTHPTQIDFISQNQDLEGYYYPVRLNDTYGLQIDCSINNQIQAQAAKSFITLKSEIEQQISKQLTIIGQTWMISGWLPENSHQNPEDIAKACYYALFPGNDWLPNQGNFLGGKIYEIWKLGNTNKSIEKEHNLGSSNEHHVIIVIYPHRESAEYAAEFYSDWMGLFCYRHKISWAYWQSRLVKESLLNHYKKIEQIKDITNYKNELGENKKSTIAHQLLNNIDKILQQYTIDLLQLSFQKEIVEINLTNYETRLALIEARADENNKLDFLGKFSNLANRKYLPQITRDIGNMQLGLQLLEDTINSTRSRIEVEKAERDRNFQDLVAVAGSVIATATLLQSPAKDFCSKESMKDIFPKIPYFCEYPFSFSLATAFLIGFVVWNLRKRMQA